MKRLTQSWYCLIFGAWGGLSGWCLGALIFGAADQDLSFRMHIGYGALLGGAMGMLASGIDSITSRSINRFIQQGGAGALAGAIGGMITLPLAETIYRRAAENGASGMGLALRAALCWALLGATIGIASTIRKGTQQWKGALGGILGGLLGGFVHESLRHNGGAGLEQTILSASLALLGGTISLSISTITSILSGAWLEVIDGRMAGRRFDLTKFITQRNGAQPRGIIGSDEWRCHVYLTGDSSILPEHATISLLDGTPTMEICHKSALVKINGDLITRAQLRDGDRLEIGRTSLYYRVKKGSRRH